MYAQETGSSKAYPLKISIMDESITYPNGSFLRYSFNPAIMIGTERILKEKPKSHWYMTGNLGFFYHKDWQTGIFLNSEFGYQRNLGRWNVHGRLGLGYLHSFATGAVYKLDAGEFQEVTDKGTHTFMPSGTVGVGYRLGEGAYSPEIFLDMMVSVELPFNYYTGVHQFTGVGVKFYPFSK